MGVAEIERAIEQLAPDELAQLADWFQEFLAEAWDRQIEADVQAGRLDKLMGEAEGEFQAGRTQPL